jgi:hypothetical protein
LRALAGGKVARVESAENKSRKPPHPKIQASYIFAPHVEPKAVERRLQVDKGYWDQIVIGDRRLSVSVMVLTDWSELNPDDNACSSSLSVRSFSMIQFCTTATQPGPSRFG